MEYTCIIIDDEPMAIEVVQNHLAHIGHFDVAGTFTNPLAGSQYLAEHPVDLLFLDIEMPAITGFGLLKTLSSSPKVIITTAHRNYAAEAFDFEVVDYLLKPIPLERMMKAINRFNESVSVRPLAENSAPFHEEHLIVKANKRFHSLSIHEILFIESMDDFIRIYTHNSKLDVYDRLVGMEAKLPTRQFIRVHRSFLVNRTKIDSFSSSEIFIQDFEIPIGKSYRDGVIKLLTLEKPY